MEYIMSRHNWTTLKLVAMVLVVLPVIWTGVWLSHQPSSGCQNKRVLNLTIPFIVTGVLLLLLALAQLVLWFLLGKDKSTDEEAEEDELDKDKRTLFRLLDYVGCGLVVVSFMLLVFTGFLLIYVTDTGTDSYTDSYIPTNWLRNKVVNHNFHKIRHCLVYHTNVCSPFLDHLYQQSQTEIFTSIQNGCCKPPKECNFTYTSPGVWSRPSTNATISDKTDCSKWSNDPNTLCFNCQTCKDGFLHDLRGTWTAGGISSFIVCLLLVSLVCCCCCGAIDSSGTTGRSRPPRSKFRRFFGNKYR
ncbi:tetraspanin-2 [Beta vulgaris subsp. vulgaris]|uniref:tetraspanin-2 n=1 Tax=Beta vulgaris subsp. vulgaris TaxID=3555 RepID=UPI0020367672|nr:tetraspanin-2 [Beta vulgaris subsp. vulgaris]